MKNILIKIFLTAFFILPSIIYAAATPVKTEDGYIVYDEQKSDLIRFKYDDVLVEPGSVGTGDWFPKCTSLMNTVGFPTFKINLFYGAAMSMDMAGRGVARWPEAVRLYFEGEENEGHASMDYGIQLEAIRKSCGQNDSQSEPIPNIPNFDLRFFDKKTFTPFLMDGSIQDPISLQDSIDHFDIWSGSLHDLIGISIGVGPIDIAQMLMLSFDLDGYMFAEIFGSKMVIDEKAGRFMSADNQFVVVDPSMVDTNIKVPIHYEAQRYMQIKMVFTIGIYINVVLFDIGVDIPIAIPFNVPKKTWVFNSNTVRFDFPAFFIKERMHNFLRTRPGDDDSWEFEVENIGSKKLVGKMLMETENNDFVLYGEDVSLDPGESTTVKVVFKPRTEGVKTGVVKFFTNDPVEPETNVALYGYGSKEDEYDSGAKESDESHYSVTTTTGGCSTVIMDDSNSSLAIYILIAAALLSLTVLRRRRNEA